MPTRIVLFDIEGVEPGTCIALVHEISDYSWVNAYVTSKEQ